MAEERLPFLSHLEELRKRLIRSFLAIAATFGVCWYYGDAIRDFLVQPLLVLLPPDQRHLTALKVTEPFVIKLKLAFYAALFLASPVILYQVWAFVSPALYKKERKYVGLITFFSVLLFTAGLAFGYWVFLPLCFRFFVTFIQGYLIQNYALAEYVSFTVWSLLAFGLVFQTPLVLLMLNLVGLVNAPLLRRFRKYAFLLAFVVGAILTATPDAVNQIVMSLPVYLFYEISIIVITLFGRKKKPEEAPAASPAG
jgi:sec-independent protein translocase protein TatC